MYSSTSGDSPLLDPQILTLHLIATGLVRTFRRAEKQGRVGPPYESTLQTGLNRLLLSWVQYKTAPAPTCIPDLISRCYLPLDKWEGVVWNDQITGSEILLKHGVPTQFCEELACLHPDVEADLTEQHLLKAVLNLCEENDAPHTYIAFRKLLIEHPVISTLDLLEYSGDLGLSLLQAKLEESYESISAALIADDGTVKTCQHCGNALVPLQTGAFRCDEPECDTGEAVVVGAVYVANKDRPLRLKRGLRIFIAAPGRSELRLAAKLTERGVKVELWPAFDRYDLRLTFPDNSVWAVDVKDWQNPYQLSTKLSVRNPLPYSPPWQLGYFVFPDRRKSERTDYKRVIEGRCRFPKNIYLCFESEFLRRVNKKLKETTHA